MREVSNNPVHVSCDGCPKCDRDKRLKAFARRVFEQDNREYSESIDALMRDNRGHAGLR